MAKAHEPTEAEKDKKRKEIIAEGKQWMLDPREVKLKEQKRLYDWALGIMKKHEHLFTPDKPYGQIFKFGDLEPEDIDVKAIYKRTDLNWSIHRDKTSAGDDVWVFMLLDEHRMLFKVGFAKF